MLSHVRLYGTGLAYKTGVYERLLERGLVRRWLRNLNDFRRARGQTPLSHQDFHRVYRQAGERFTNTLTIPAGASPDEHLRVWTAPEAEYLLLYGAWKLGRYPLIAHKFSRHVQTGNRIIEYGCGVAPITESLRRYHRHLHVNVTCADLPTLPFRYAQHRLRRDPAIRFLQLSTDDDRPLQEDYDVIFCMTVFEHLPRPLAIAEHFYDRLKPGGRLIFDYLNSSGVGVDTVEAVLERPAVFGFLRERFAVDLEESSAGPFVLTKAYAALKTPTRNVADRAGAADTSH